jgi:hypothetical protein
MNNTKHTKSTTYTADEKCAIAAIKAALKLKRLDPRRLYIVDDGAYSWIGDRSKLSAANARILRDVKNSTEEEYEAACRCRCLASSDGGGDAYFFDLPESWRDGSALGPISPL